MRRLSLRSGADFTKATLIRLGQALNASYVCYGSYDLTLTQGESDLKNASLQVTAHIIDLTKMHNGPDASEAGKLTELSKLSEHLAWQSLKYLDPTSNQTVDQFLAPQKLIRLDALESYSRGLLSTSPDQQQRWFSQAVALDPHFSNPAFELGNLFYERKDYRQALVWLQRINSNDPRYAEARFKMGLAAYAAGDYTTSAGYFRDVAKNYPLGEVYNNLGAAENRLNLPVALDDFRKALDGDQNDTVYLFNMGAALLKSGNYVDATKKLEAVIDKNPADTEARSLLEHARRHENFAPVGNSPGQDRLKKNFDPSAFRQLKAMVQSKGGSE